MAGVLPSYGQLRHQQTMRIELDTLDHRLKVKQTLTVENRSNQPLDSIYLNDWANAYGSTKSPLALRLVEEYNRSFYLSKTSKRGFTKLLHMTVRGKEINWYRPKGKNDQIVLPLVTPLEVGQSLSIHLEYITQLPDAKFTGYGIRKEKEYFLENFFISLGWHQNGEWKTLSHLDLEDSPHQSGKINVELVLGKAFSVTTRLLFKKENMQGENKHLYYEGVHPNQLLFHIEKNSRYTAFLHNNQMVFSNLKAEGLGYNDQEKSLQKIIDYVTTTLGSSIEGNCVFSEEKYNKRPFYGFTLIPGIFKPFSPLFEFEIKALNTYLYSYLATTFSLHPRDDYWLIGGLHSYLMMHFVNHYYPNEKLFGLILRQPLARFLLNKYKFTDLSFDETFLLFHEFTLRRNLQQALFTPKEELIKYNEQIGNPSQMGVLLDYLIAHDKINFSDLVNDLKRNKASGDQLKALFFTQLESIDDEDFIPYMKNRKSLDFYYSSFIKKNTSIEFSVSEKNNWKFPFTVGWMRNDTIINTERFSALAMDTNIKRPIDGAEYLVINPTVKLPEFNPRNNFRKTSKKAKTPRFTFIKDIENPQYQQFFYNPRVNFNIYDGLTLGMRLNNLTIQRNPFSFTIEPFYATAEQTLVGNYAAALNLLNEQSNYYLKNLQITGSSFHYDQSLRYNLLRTSINIYKRNTDLRSNKRTLIRLFWQYVHREQNENTDLQPNYNLGGVTYVYSNKGALKHFTLRNQLEANTSFGKLNFTLDFRHLTSRGRQFSFRLFAGKFLWRNSLNTQYFDYAIDRPTDYLFQYNYLGRSESTGIYSQQFIPAEGGFKYSFDQRYVDDFIFTLNTSMGLWKWVEIYGDIGWFNTSSTSVKHYFDTGIRLNLLPDFLEFYFPIYNSDGLQIDKNTYNQHIRFLLTIEPKALNQLFSRKWF